MSIGLWQFPCGGEELKGDATLVVVHQSSPRTNATEIEFSIATGPGISPLTLVDLSPIGTLASQADLQLSGAAPTYQATATITDSNAEGTLGLRITAQTQPGGEPVVAESDFVVIDHTAPIPTLGPPSVAITSSGPVTFSLIYSEDAGEVVSPALTEQDLELVTTGNVSGAVTLESVSRLEFRITISQLSGDGTAAVLVGSDTAVDDAGNSAAASEVSAAVQIENLPLTVSISPPAPAATRFGPVTFTVTYLGATTITLSLDDIDLIRDGTANADLSLSGEGDRQRTLELTNIVGSGSLAIAIAADTARDDLGTIAPAAGPSFPVLIDDAGPVVILGPPSTSIARSLPVEFVVTISGADEVFLGVEHVDLTEEGTATADIVVSGDSLVMRTITLTNISGDGALLVSILAGAAIDSVQNPSEFVEPSGRIIVDNTPPTVTLEQRPGQPDPATQLPISFDVAFSEAVTGFSPTDLRIDGTASGVAVATNGSGDEYRVFVTAVATPGTIELSLRSGAAEDVAGNSSLASSSMDNQVTFIGEDPQCQLESSTVLFPPDGSQFIVGPGSRPVAIQIRSETNCRDDDFLVEYTIDDLLIGTVNESPYTVAIDDLLAVLSLGKHVLIATVTDPVNGIVIESDPVNLTIAIGEVGEDQDGNGYPDLPFVSLADEADMWLSTVVIRETGLARSVFARRWELAPEVESSLVLDGGTAEDGGPHFEISAARDLLNQSESGILLLTTGGNAETILESSTLSNLGNEPPQGLFPGGAYADLSILVLDGINQSVVELPDERLVNSPLSVVIRDLPIIAGGGESLFSHPTLAGFSESGLRIAASPGGWTTENIQNTQIFDGRIEAELVSLSLIAPFDRPLVAGEVISVRPTVLGFGEVEIGTFAEAEVVVANTGDVLLEGRVTVVQPFTIVSGGSYAIAPDGEHIVRLRFSPVVEASADFVAQFSGGAGATVFLSGTGLSPNQGCAASPGALTRFPRDGLADTMGLLALVMLLALGPRRSPRT